MFRMVSSILDTILNLHDPYFWYEFSDSQQMYLIKVFINHDLNPGFLMKGKVLGLIHICSQFYS